MINITLEQILGGIAMGFFGLFSWLANSYITQIKTDIKELKEQNEEEFREMMKHSHDMQETVAKNNETLVRIATAYEETAKHVDSLTHRMNEVEKDVVKQERDSRTLFHAIAEMKNHAHK
jgi:methyl-accepting chemotaxis protein